MLNIEKTSRNRVKGFLHTDGARVVNEAGEDIILTGWGLGNWLLCEGYMWLSGPGSRFDRPRRIEAVIQELAGSGYAETFWRSYRENYVSREDIRCMASLGYNSVRIPISWRIFMEEEPGVVWKEDGFALLDRCLNWCEEYGLYAFLDLHAAPGGQTGSNIDDTLDDYPRLFTDEDSRIKCIELWKELVRRYRNRWIVGGYDLLNEPIRPGLEDGDAVGALLPALARFYERVIGEIRRIDKKHMLTVEGHHWATDTAVFYKRYDENMLIHFHRYGCMPGIECLKPYLNCSARLNQPLWLGESGENTLEWYTALFPLCVSLGIGYNLWTWKKMTCENSPCSVNKPAGWDKIIDYTQGGKRPGYGETQAILNEYLENIKLERCTLNPSVTDAVFRRPSFSVRATDFDLLPGKGVTFSGLRDENNLFNYHRQAGMKITPVTDGRIQKRFVFDSGWDLLALELQKSEFACYSLNNVSEGCTITLEVKCNEDSQLCITQDETEIASLNIIKSEEMQKIPAGILKQAEQSRIKVYMLSGSVLLCTLNFARP